MLDWLDFSGLGPYLGRFRAWLDKQPRRDFSEITTLQKAGRIVLIVVALALIVFPFVLIMNR